MNPHFSTAPFWVGKQESPGIEDTSSLIWFHAFSESAPAEGERTALQAERPHAAGGKICDIMDVRETLISKGSVTTNG